MSDEPRLHFTAMEGKGAYNTHAALQASGGALAVPSLEEAARRISLDFAERPLVIADYGSSQGKNSLAPLRAAISVLRTRVSRERPILVFHTDLPANDFNELFGVVEDDPNSYLRGEPHVFPSAIGRSFYRQLFPPDHVDLGWSSYAALWLSRIPRPIPGHFYIPCSSGAVRPP
jgi:SAM dependent carboxyl methyltransferase